MHCVTSPESHSGRAGISHVYLTQELIFLTTFSPCSDKELQMGLLYLALQDLACTSWEY